VKVKDLMRLLERHDPDATVVVLDRSEFVRCGLLRPLNAKELRSIPLGLASDGWDTWVCDWKDRADDADGPLPGLLVGPD
jgi:hypothetical protein